MNTQKIVKRTQKQQNFELMICPYPDIYALWDFDRAEYSPDMAREYLAMASHGERVLAKFFLCVWLNTNEFDFDLFDAAAVLAPDELQTIVEWLENTFWP